LTLGSWWLLYEGAVGTTTKHRHHAVQVIAATEPVVVGGNCGEHCGCALIIPADVDHAISRTFRSHLGLAPTDLLTGSRWLAPH
jgi:hypothetical protein